MIEVHDIYNIVYLWLFVFEDVTKFYAKKNIGVKSVLDRNKQVAQTFLHSTLASER